MSAATAAQVAAALDVLRQPIQDRPREFWTGDNCAMLIDDGGGQPIEAFDDATAVHHFIAWLDARRAARTVLFEVQARRAGIKLVKGGAHDGN